MAGSLEEQLEWEGDLQIFPNNQDTIGTTMPRTLCLDMETSDQSYISSHLRTTHGVSDVDRVQRLLRGIAGPVSLVLGRAAGATTAPPTYSD